MRVLIGGGWDPVAQGLTYGPFLDEAGHNPTIACIVIDEGDGLDQFRRWSSVLERTAPCRPVPILLPRGELLDTDRLHDADGVLVCGGLTPAYAEALTPVAGAIRDWLAQGRPYAGFSAGAAIAADRAIVGGFRSAGRAVCPEDAGEDLAEIAVVDGLGLVSAGVEVHAAQWGTLGRLVAAVDCGLLIRGVAVDENTAMVITGEVTQVVGIGAVHLVGRVGVGRVGVGRVGDGGDGEVGGVGAGVVVHTVAAGRTLPPDWSAK